MISHIHISQILVALSIQRICAAINIYCAEAVKSVEIVSNCPTLKEDWETAAFKKNCSSLAGRQNCSTESLFIYHCVINGYRNETLSVCAPRRVIFGFCTEFNVAGGFIQEHRSRPCNNQFPKCDKRYYSSDSYKYHDCYALVNISTTETTTPDKPGNGNITKIVVPIVTVTVIVGGIAVLVWLVRRGCIKKKGKQYETKTEQQQELDILITTEGCIKEKGKKYETKTEQQQGLNILITTEEYRKKKGKKYETNTEQQQELEFLSTLEGSIQKIEGSTGSIQKNKGSTDTLSHLVIKDTDVATTTDKYAIAILNSKEDLRLDNEEESNRYLRYYRTMNNYFVETEIYKQAETIFEKHGILILIGPPGCGKTISAIHMIFKKLKDEANWTFRKIHSWTELSYTYKDEKSLVFIDNIFFRRTMDLHLDKWWNEFKCIHDRYFAPSEMETGRIRLRIIMTARQNAIERACSYMENTSPILHVNFFKEVGKLTESEKEQILSKQIEFASTKKRINIKFLDPEFKRKVRESDGPIGFPLCAHLFVCGEEYQKSGIEFFSSPIQYLKHQIKDEIENDKTNRTKSLFFYLFFFEWHSKMGNLEKLTLKSESKCVRFLENISAELLANFSPFEFKDLEGEAQRLSGAFFKKVGEYAYRFVHDSVYEAVGTLLCEAYPLKAVMYFPLDIIQSLEFESLSTEQTIALATRLLYEALDQRLSEVFSFKVLRNTKFAEVLCSELLKKDTKTIAHFITIANRSSSVKLPCMFWSSCNHLTFLTERFYNIVNDRKLASQYHLYASLYGMCCAKNAVLLHATNGKLVDNLEKLKELVINFNDEEKNSILHLLVSSTYSDRYITIAVKQLIKDKLPVEKRNQQRISPLMFAVEQTLSRMDVIETLVNCDSKTMHTDSNNSTVLHHCVGSLNDDKTCAEYMRIILEKHRKHPWIGKVDAKGDTALSIAAKCETHSRVQSILILLESDEYIVNKVSDDGCSPLHLTVKSLQKKSPFVELECCVRVITFIIYGADLTQKSDKNVEAINECQYESIKTILRHPDNVQVMEKELDLILGKLKHWKKPPIFSLHSHSKISKELHERIEHAVSYLQNSSFDNLPTEIEREPALET